MTIRAGLQLARQIGRTAVAVGGAITLAGCAALPASGPTGAQIRRTSDLVIADVPSRLIDVADASSLPVREPLALSPFVDRDPPPTDMVGPGDVLDIAVYEAGVTLFSGGARAISDAATFDPSAKVERLPPNRVDDAGEIRLPYIGRLRVAGMTVGEVAQRVRERLRGFSQNPQVLVTIREAVTNSVIVGGEVGRPGRLVLTSNRESLSDALALAGGYRGDAKDLSIRLMRQGMAAEYRLSDVLDGPDRDLRVYPGDRLSVLRRARSFSVMGAPGRVEQLLFSGANESLAEALAQAGGANPNLGDPKAIFVFRFVRNAEGKEVPTIYHFNMMTAGAFFLAQRFGMQDKDVLYVGNAGANQPSKLIQLISQLFSPLVVLTSAAQTLKN